MIETLIGLIDEDLLEQKEGSLDNENEYTTWKEWWMAGQLVKRDVHVTIKQGTVAGAIAGSF